MIATALLVSHSHASISCRGHWVTAGSNPPLQYIQHLLDSEGMYSM